MIRHVDGILYELYKDGWMFSHLDTRVLKKRRFKVLKDFHIRWGKFHYVVEKGEIIDFASIPPGFRNVFDVLGPSRLPAAMHDSMYANKRATREWCDQLFKKALRGVGMNPIKVYCYYWAVRLGGWTRGNW